MDNLPTPDDHSLYDGNIVIDQVEATLRRFGGDLSQQDAVRLLGLWRKNSQLTARERAAVLARFTPSADQAKLVNVLGTFQDGQTETASGDDA